MNHLDMLKEILDGQHKSRVKKGDWKGADYEARKSIFHGCTEIKIESAEIIFIFNRNGQFVGICNYKQ